MAAYDPFAEVRLSLNPSPNANDFGGDRVSDCCFAMADQGPHAHDVVDLVVYFATGTVAFFVRKVPYWPTSTRSGFVVCSTATSATWATEAHRS